MTDKRMADKPELSELLTRLHERKMVNLHTPLQAFFELEGMQSADGGWQVSAVVTNSFNKFYYVAASEGIATLGRSANVVGGPREGVAYGAQELLISVASMRAVRTLILCALLAGAIPTFAATLESTVALAAGNGQFVAVGKGGFVASSPDGVAWTLRRTPAATGRGPRLAGVAFGNGRFVAAGDRGRILVSQDGASWQALHAAAIRNVSILRLRFAGSRFYLIGSRYRNYRKREVTAALFASIDGVRWEAMRAPGDVLLDIAGEAGKLVILGGRGEAYRLQPDGTWQVSTLVPGPWRGRDNRYANLAWNGTAWVAAYPLGYGTVLARSADGLHWSTKEFKGFDRLYYALTWNGRAFVAAGPSSFAISADGASWRILSFEGQLLYPSSIAGDNGRTVFTGSPNYRTPSLFVSPDGTEWYVAVAPLVLAAGEARAASLQPLAAVARDEGEELAHEERRNAAASALIGFALSGVGILLYVGLQAWALWRMRGWWRLVAALPALFMALVLAATIAGYAQRSNLWPLLLIFGLPLAVACLVVLVLVWLGGQWLAAKAGRR